MEIVYDPLIPYFDPTFETDSMDSESESGYGFSPKAEEGGSDQALLDECTLALWADPTFVLLSPDTYYRDTSLQGTTELTCS